MKRSADTKKTEPDRPLIRFRFFLWSMLLHRIMCGMQQIASDKSGMTDDPFFRIRTQVCGAPIGYQSAGSSLCRSFRQAPDHVRPFLSETNQASLFCALRFAGIAGGSAETARTLSAASVSQIRGGVPAGIRRTEVSASGKIAGRASSVTGNTAIAQTAECSDFQFLQLYGAIAMHPSFFR